MSKTITGLLYLLLVGCGSSSGSGGETIPVGTPVVLLPSGSLEDDRGLLLNEAGDSFSVSTLKEPAQLVARMVADMPEIYLGVDDGRTVTSSCTGGTDGYIKLYPEALRREMITLGLDSGARYIYAMQILLFHYGQCQLKLPAGEGPCIAMMNASCAAGRDAQTAFKGYVSALERFVETGAMVDVELFRKEFSLAFPEDGGDQLRCIVGPEGTSECGW